jgi:hypothetical protein
VDERSDPAEADERLLSLADSLAHTLEREEDIPDAEEVPEGAARPAELAAPTVPALPPLGLNI